VAGTWHQPEWGDMKLLGYLFVLCGLTFAQSDRGSITGLISDPAGAVVSAAAIEARNTATGGVYQAVSTGTGNYALSELPTLGSLLRVCKVSLLGSQTPGRCYTNARLRT
jgi:hypothetical protein